MLSRSAEVILRVYYGMLYLTMTLMCVHVMFSLAPGGTRTLSGRFRSSSVRAAHRVRSRLLRMLHQCHVAAHILRIPHRTRMLVETFLCISNLKLVSL